MRDLSNLHTSHRRHGYHQWDHLVCPNASQGHPLVREWPDRGFRGFGQSQEHDFASGWASYWASFSEPPLISGIVILVGNFNHSYHMPPIHCLGASSFLPFGCLGWGHCTSNGSCLASFAMASQGSSRWIGYHMGSGIGRVILNGKESLRNNRWCSSLTLHLHPRTTRDTSGSCSMGRGPSGVSSVLALHRRFSGGHLHWSPLSTRGFRLRYPCGSLCYQRKLRRFKGVHFWTCSAAGALWRYFTVVWSRFVRACSAPLGHAFVTVAVPEGEGLGWCIAIKVGNTMVGVVPPAMFTCNELLTKHLAGCASLGMAAPVSRSESVMSWRMLYWFVDSNTVSGRSCKDRPLMHMRAGIAVRDMPNRQDNLHEQRSMECVGFGEAISNVTLEPKP